MKMLDKKDFFQLYEDAKNGKVDVLTLPSEIVKKMCFILEEEIKIIEKDIKKISSKFNN